MKYTIALAAFFGLALAVPADKGTFTVDVSESLTKI
jgi:hypothetical protein